MSMCTCSIECVLLTLLLLTLPFEIVVYLFAVGCDHFRQLSQYNPRRSSFGGINVCPPSLWAKPGLFLALLPVLVFLNCPGSVVKRSIYTERPNCRKRDVLLNVFANIILPRALLLRPSGRTEANINMDAHLDILWVSRSELLHFCVFTAHRAHQFKSDACVQLVGKWRRGVGGNV